MGSTAKLELTLAGQVEAEITEWMDGSRDGQKHSCGQATGFVRDLYANLLARGVLELDGRSEVSGHSFTLTFPGAWIEKYRYADQLAETAHRDGAFDAH